jgi:hypothetical protein
LVSFAISTVDTGRTGPIASFAWSFVLIRAAFIAIFGNHAEPESRIEPTRERSAFRTIELSTKFGESLASGVQLTHLVADAFLAFLHLLAHPLHRLAGLGV